MDRKKGSGGSEPWYRQRKNPGASGGSEVLNSPEAEPIASGSGSLRSSLRTASARIDHEVIFVVAAFLPLPLGRS